jgi:membrane protease YdiL (CAAX protease family)
MREDTEAARPPGGGSILRRAFVGPLGLRSGWRLVLFVALFSAVSTPLVWLTLRWIGGEDRGWTAAVLGLAETISLVSAVAAVAVMARIERRSFADYGVPLRDILGARFREGSLAGLLSIAAVVGLIAAAGGYRVSGLALAARETAFYALAWALVFLVLAVFEELTFRGYMLYTLATGLGFWPAAVVLSGFFGFVLHYLAKPGETWVDGLGTTLIGLFFCLSVRRTGDVWYAVGWHFTFNYGSMFVFGSPNTGNDGHPVAKHLLEASFFGPQWLTGGPMGAEASLFVFPVLGVVTLLLLRRHRTVRYRPSSGGYTRA